MTRRSLKTLLPAVLVFAGYGLGAWIGFRLRLPPATTSVLWPPNAILTAALLLTPPRRWWVSLLGALPAHMLVELGSVPLSLATAFYFTNCSEALLAAGLVHALSDAPARFDTLRRTAIFALAAGLVAPFVSCFPDAAAVHWLRGEPFWRVVWMRLPSNMLVQLTLVPAIVAVVADRGRWLWTAARARRLEALLLALGFLTVGSLVFAGPAFGRALLPGAQRTPFVFVIPFLLWSAVRFGARGTSLTLLGTALIAIGTAIRGGGPFATLAPQEGVVALQVALIIVTLPFLCLAPLIEERRDAQHALGQRLQFEELLSGLAGAFVQLPSAKIDGAVAEWLGRVCDYFGLDAVLLLRGGGRDSAPEITHRWTTAALGPLPPEATDDLASAQGARSDPDWWRVSVPLVAGGQTLGRIAFFSVSQRETAPAHEQRLALVADVFAGALARQNAEDELRASEAMKSAILTSLPSLIGVLDREGRIIAVNDSWTRFARLGGTGHETSLRVGANYMEACRRGDVGLVPNAQEALDGIEGVLAGWLSSYALEYASRGPGAERWFAMSVVPLLRPEGGAIVSHTDVTERRRAGLEAQQSRQELAHFLRVSTMGELTTSLAHELNQPLAAILANAQAARLLLAGPKPDTKELREIISDVIDEDKRAGAVIQRLREMLRKGTPERARLDINGVVEGVVHLLGSDALIRNISIRLEPHDQMPAVNGDRVQIEQVVLNLLLNAMEAMTESPNGERKIVVRNEETPDGHVRVSVADSGPGLRADALPRVFEPFYTTKAAGMGMGLSIARSIIEAHGGTISAANNPAGGAVFTFSLPPAR